MKALNFIKMHSMLTKKSTISERQAFVMEHPAFYNNTITQLQGDSQLLHDNSPQRVDFVYNLDF